MTDMLPIVEELADCATHAERASWLLRAPPFVFHRDHMALRRILQAANHRAGVAYVEAKFSEQSATRMADGSTVITILSAVYIAETDLKISARYEGQ